MHGIILYIDPGSGSYLVQAIVAAALGAAFYFKVGVNWVKSFFQRKKKED
jgi:ATP-dependent 26S proteasome regulatory subunit